MQESLNPAPPTAGGRAGAVTVYLYTSGGSLNSRQPANMRYKIHPRDHISTLLVFGIDVSSISGAM